MKGSYSPLIYDYLRKYQEEPRSRIFAPLAEAYRKAGLIDEAIEIAREGVIIHPTFIGGRVALARALFEKKLYIDVIEELASVARDAPDNLVAQRLLAESNLILGRTVEALDSYKMLLYFNPQDREVGRIVQELEQQAYREGVVVLQTDAEPIDDGMFAPTVEPASETKADDFSHFAIAPAQTALRKDPEVTRAERQEKIQKVEKLQDMLGKVARYRAKSAGAGMAPW